MRRITTTAALIALAGTLGGCGLGCKDVNRVRARTSPAFTITRTGGGATTGALLSGFADYTQRETVPEFARVFAVVARNSGDGRNLQFTLTGYEATPGDRISLTLSVPSRAQQGDRFHVVRAFAPPAPWTGEWTFRDPVSAGETEIAFVRSRATIPNPPYNYAAVYTATRAEGTVEVRWREAGRITLRVDLTATDDTGRGYRLAGDVEVTAATEGEACPTFS